MKQTLLIGLILSSSLLYSQTTFQKTYGGSLIDAGTDIKSTPDGGFIMSGYGESYSSGGDDYYLIKTDAFGNEEWARSIGYSSDPDRSEGVAVMADGSYAIGGYTELGVNSVMTSRFDQSGNHLWTSHYEGPTCSGSFRDMIPTADTGLVVLSQTCNLSSIIRYNKNGDTLWTSTYATSSFAPIKIIQNHNGNYMVLGGDGGPISTDGIYLLEISDIGDSLSAHTYHTPLGFLGYDFTQTSDSSYYITGIARGTVDDIMLLKIDKNGSSQWAKKFTGPNHDRAKGIIESLDGNLIIFSDTWSHSSGSNWDYMLSKVDKAGNLLWSNSYGGNSQEYSWAIEQANDSTYLLMGSSYTFSEGSSDIYFLRTDADGFTGCNEQVATPGSSVLSIVEIPSAIAKYNGLNAVAYSGSPIINNISLLSSTECENFTAITNVTDVSCYGACDGVGICIVSGGTPPYSIIWDDLLLQENDTAFWLCQGTYQVMIADNALDTIYRTIIIEEPNEIEIITSPDTSMCLGQTTDISASGALTYTWDQGAGSAPLVTVSPISTTTYTVTGIDGNSCSNTGQIIVTVKSLPNVTVNQLGVILTAQNSNADVSYQWVDCNDDFSTLLGDTNQIFTANANGSYSVVINENGCADTSICYNVSNVGIIESVFGNDLIVYPNPTDGGLSIDLGENHKMVKITVTDLIGKIVLSNSYNDSQLMNLKLSEPSGVYLLMIESGNKKAVIRLIKT